MSITQPNRINDSRSAQIDPSGHIVQFYDSDEYLLNTLTGFVRAGLAAHDGCIVIATKAHRAALERRLAGEEPVRFAIAHAEDAYLALDARETLAQFMVNGTLVPQRFREVIGGAIARAGRNGRSVRAYGEMVTLLWLDGNSTGAIQLEELWNDLRESSAFTLCCGYPMKAFEGEAYAASFAEICHRHTHVIPDESYTSLVTADERLRAISLLQQKALSLEAEIAERKATEERLQALINMASHELKTPVTSLKGFTQILQRRLRQQDADPQTLLFVERMNTQITRLATLIGDLLDISKMETGMLALAESDVDLDELVRETVENVQAATTTHRLILEGTTHAVVLGDRERLGQVLINLLTNAIKYSPEADTVRIRLSRDGERAEVAVRDFGIGIDAQYHERIFERFYQVTDQHGNTYPGLGIGLYIARTLLERHRGQLCVESNKGAGSTFRFTLPVIHSAHPALGGASLDTLDTLDTFDKVADSTP